MPRHQDKDASFETPEDWVDRTIVAHAVPTAPKSRDAAPNFVMTREAMLDGESLRSHADRQMVELGRHLKDFDLLESREAVCGGEPAVFLRYTWMGHFGRLEQSVTIVERALETGRITTSFTTTAPADEVDKTRAVFDEVLKTVRFVGGGPKTGGPPPPPTRPSEPRGDVGGTVVPMPGQRGGRR